MMTSLAVFIYLQGKADPINSAFHLTYNMVLNLLRVEQINPEYILERSFFQFQNYSSIPELCDRKLSFINIISWAMELKGLVMGWIVRSLYCMSYDGDHISFSSLFSWGSFSYFSKITTISSLMHMISLSAVIILHILIFSSINLENSLPLLHILGVSSKFLDLFIWLWWCHLHQSLPPSVRVWGEGKMQWSRGEENKILVSQYFLYY